MPPEGGSRLAVPAPPPGDPEPDPRLGYLDPHVDSWYDAYRGVVIVVRMIDGVIKSGMKMRLMATAQEFPVEQVGVFTPKSVARESLSAGEVGFTEPIDGLDSVVTLDTSDFSAPAGGSASCCLRASRPITAAPRFAVTCSTPRSSTASPSSKTKRGSFRSTAR